ncbi:unnamed protein product [Schistosoma bovis]|nr:unnamed protein product [Schistosoma bovis]
MNDINNFLDRVASEVFERIRRPSNAIMFNIPDTYALKNIKSSLLRANNMKHVPCVCTRLKRSHPGMHSPILFKFNSSVDASEFLTSSNSLRQKQVFKDIKILPDRTPCQRKTGRDSYRPPASNSQTHHNPNGRKIKSDSKRTSSFTSMPLPKNSSESPKVQNPEESNLDVGGVHPLKNVDLDSTHSSCADDEWDNTVQTTVGATPSYSNCATDNRKTSHNIYITDRTLNLNIFEPRKPSQVCLTTHDSPQTMKKPKLTTNLGNKHLEHVTHTSGINSNLNCKWPLGRTHRPDSLLGPAPNMYTILLSDVTSNSNEKTFCDSASNGKHISNDDKVVESISPRNTTLTLANPTSIHGTTNCDLYSNLLHYDNSEFLILSFDARSLSNKIIHLKTLLFLVNPTIVLITETWCDSSISDHSLNVDNYVFFRTDRCYGLGGGTIIYVHSDIQACKFEDKSLDAIDDSTWVTVNCGPQNYLLVGYIYRPPHTDTKFDKLLTNIFSIASHQPHTFKIIGGDFNLPKVTWDSTPVPGRYNKLVETLEICGWVQQVRKPTSENNILDLLFTINIDSISVHTSHEFFLSDHRVVLSIIHSLNTIQLNSKASVMYQSRHFDQQTWK